MKNKLLLKTKRNLIKNFTHLIFLLILLLSFISCTDEIDVPVEQTVTDIKQDIENSFEGVVDCLQGYENGEFSSALQTFFMVSNGDMNAEYSDFLTDQLDVFNFDFENFVISEYSGVYNWNSTSDQWDFTSNTQNKLIFNFPFLETGNSNNMTATIDNYEVQEIVLNSNTEYYPTKLIGSVEKDNVEIFNLMVDDVSYQIGTEDVVPTSFDIEIMTSPMTHSFTLEETSTNQLSFIYSSFNNNSCVLGFEINSQTTTSDYTNIEGIDNFSSAEITITINQLMIVFSSELSSLNAISEPTIDEINQYINSNVLLSGDQIGTLEYTEIGSSPEVIIIYNDGTSENVDTYVNEALGNEIEAVFSNFFN